MSGRRKPPPRTSAAAKRAREEAAWRRAQGLALWSGVAGLATLALTAMPVAGLALVGLLPTLAAWIIDSSRRGYLTMTVAGANLSGVVPVALTLLREGADLHGLGQALSNPFAWLAMYGAAALGWGLFVGVPPLMHAHVAGRVATQRDSLVQRQRELAEEWGERFGGPPPEPGSTATVA